MFSTVENVDKPPLYVENPRKNSVFAWKNHGLHVEKQRRKANGRMKSRKSLMQTGFQLHGTKRKSTFCRVENMWRKNFFHVEKYVESVTNRAESSFSALWKENFRIFATHI